MNITKVKIIHWNDDIYDVYINSELRMIIDNAIEVFCYLQREIKIFELEFEEKFCK